MDVLLTVIAAAFTLISPLGIAWAKKDSWSSMVKIAIPILVSLVIAVLYVVFTGAVDFAGDLLQAFLVVFGLQQLVYSTILKQLATILEARGQDEEPAHRLD